MNYGSPTPSLLDDEARMSLKIARAFPHQEQIEGTADRASAASHWVATFAHISPAGVLTTGAYFSDPSNTVVTRFLFSLAEGPATSAHAQR